MFMRFVFVTDIYICVVIVVFIGTKCKSPIYVTFDAGIVSQTMMLTAHFFGVGSLLPSLKSNINTPNI